MIAGLQGGLDPGSTHHIGEARQRDSLRQMIATERQPPAPNQIGREETNHQLRFWCYFARRTARGTSHVWKPAFASKESCLTERSSFERIALLLQGGATLGSYQAGVCHALAPANLMPTGLPAFRSARSTRP